MGDSESIRQLLIGHISNEQESNDKMQIVTCRLLANYLAKREQSKHAQDLEFLQNALSILKPVAFKPAAYIMLAHNTMIWFGRFKVEKSDIYTVIIESMCHLMTEQGLSDNLMYYCLLITGTCAWASKSAKASILDVFGDSELKEIVSNAKQLAGSPAMREICDDLSFIFDWC